MSSGMYNTTPPTITTGQTQELQVDSRGSLKVTVTQADGTNAITFGGLSDGASNGINTGIVQTRPTIFNGTTWDREVKPNATARIVSSAATTNATSVKASTGNVHTITCHNVNAAARYLKLYNKASAPTVGTDTPVWTEYLPATSKVYLNFSDQPLYFATGIALALTTGSGDADATAVGAGDILGLNVAYS